ncbi:MAG: sulfotransferase domain-containing protein [Bacteroidetes bacterium]|nr:sulfotransferase domain-containing protein [Bacteroidota bacterium]
MKELKQNFICIGAQKAGTTTLADILYQHSEICIPPIKETKFFLFDTDYQKGNSFYNSYFTNYQGQKAVGEFDPDYLLFPFTAKRIAETLGEKVKIIVVLRNPADRAYSHYLMTRKKGLDDLDFENAILAEKNRKQDIKTQKIFAYIERGMYGKHLNEFLKVFPPENFLFLVFEEDFIQNKENTIRKVQEFLNVPYEALNLNIHSNEAGEAQNEVFRDLVRKPNFAKKLLKFVLPSKEARKNIRKFFIRKNIQKVASPKLSQEVRSRILQTYFMDDIHLTEQLINRNLGVWYK